ncbi:MAG: cytochrome c oxidase subunit II [Phycisphaerae bacterium]
MTRATLLAQQDKTFWMPEPASTTAASVDTAFYFILFVALFFFVLIIGLMFAFIIMYRRRQPGEAAPSKVSHSTPLEITWAVIPIILVVIMFWLGFKSYMGMRTMPANAYEINVDAKKWNWSFRYPGGIDHAELHVPVDTAVRLVMRSEDVIHSLYIPAFRVKRDVVPGRYADLWFKATKTGTFPLLCAEYCGTKHSDMNTVCVVHEPGGFEKWLVTADPLRKLTPEQYQEYQANPAAFLEKHQDDPVLSRLETPAMLGEKLVVKKGCMQCHTSDGKAGQGRAPSFLGMFEREHVFRDGKTLTRDYPDMTIESYVRESILAPKAKLVAGADDVMPRQTITDREIDLIIEYLTSLKQ